MDNLHRDTQPISEGELIFFSDYPELEIFNDSLRKVVECTFQSYYDKCPIFTASISYPDNSIIETAEFEKFMSLSQESIIFTMNNIDNPNEDVATISNDLWNKLRRKVYECWGDPTALKISIVVLDTEKYRWNPDSIESEINSISNPVIKELFFLLQMPNTDIDKAISHFNSKLSSIDNINFRHWLLEAIAQYTPKENDLSKLLTIFNSSTSNKVKVHILKSLSKLPSSRVTDFFLEILKENHTEMRWLASNYLSERTLNEQQMATAASFISHYYRKSSLSKNAPALFLLKNDAFKDSTYTYRAYLLQNIDNYDYDSQSVIIHLAAQWLSEEEIEPLISKFSKHHKAGMRESVLNTHEYLPLPKNILRDFMNDNDTHVKQRAQFLLHGPQKKSLAVPIEKAQGIIWGACTGDAIGGPVEFMRRQQILELYNGEVEHIITPEMQNDSWNYRLAPGSITDDSTMGLFFLRSFAEHGFLDMVCVSKLLSEEIYNVDRGLKPNTGYPTRSSMDMRKLQLGCNWRYSGHGGNGCGAAMRVFGIPLMSSSHEELIENSNHNAVITHDSVIGFASSATIAVAIDILAKEHLELSAQSFIDHVFDRLKGYQTEFKDFLQKVQLVSTIIDSKTLSDEEAYECLHTLGTSGKAIDTVPAALFCFLVSPKDFTRMMRLAVNVDGDSDSIATIAGALYGAYNGMKGIPQMDLRMLCDKEHIQNIIDQLVK